MFGVDSPIQISPSYDARWEVDSCLNASDIKSLSVLHLNVPPVTNIVASAATNGIKGETDATELEQSIAQSNAKCQLISAGRVEELKIWEVVAPVDSANDLSSRLEAQSRQLWALIEYFKVYASDFEILLVKGNVMKRLARICGHHWIGLQSMVGPYLLLRLQALLVSIFLGFKTQKELLDRCGGNWKLVLRCRLHLEDITHCSSMIPLRILVVLVCVAFSDMVLKQRNVWHSPALDFHLWHMLSKTQPPIIMLPLFCSLERFSHVEIIHPSAVAIKIPDANI